MQRTPRAGPDVVRRLDDGRDPAPDVDGEAGVADIDIDDLVRRLEDRILSEIERRGGRYVGSF